jgi:acid phosphatase family membrane protein YuiD
MTNILIITTAIAAFLAIRAMCDAVRVMRYHQMQARSLKVPFAEYVVERERETKRLLTALFYQADMERKYGRID